MHFLSGNLAQPSYRAALQRRNQMDLQMSVFNTLFSSTSTNEGDHLNYNHGRDVAGADGLDASQSGTAPVTPLTFCRIRFRCATRKARGCITSSRTKCYHFLRRYCCVPAKRRARYLCCRLPCKKFPVLKQVKVWCINFNRSCSGFSYGPRCCGGRFRLIFSFSALWGFAGNLWVKFLSLVFGENAVSNYGDSSRKLSKLRAFTSLASSTWTRSDSKDTLGLGSTFNLNSDEGDTTTNIEKPTTNRSDTPKTMNSDSTGFEHDPYVLASVYTWRDILEIFSHVAPALLGLAPFFDTVDLLNNPRPAPKNVPMLTQSVGTVPVSQIVELVMETIPMLVIYAIAYFGSQGKVECIDKKYDPITNEFVAAKGSAYLFYTEDQAHSAESDVLHLMGIITTLLAIGSIATTRNIELEILLSQNSKHPIYGYLQLDMLNEVEAEVEVPAPTDSKPAGGSATAGTTSNLQNLTPITVDATPTPSPHNNSLNDITDTAGMPLSNGNSLSDSLRLPHDSTSTPRFNAAGVQLQLELRGGPGPGPSTGTVTQSESPPNLSFHPGPQRSDHSKSMLNVNFVPPPDVQAAARELDILGSPARESNRVLSMIESCGSLGTSQGPNSSHGTLNVNVDNTLRRGCEDIIRLHDNIQSPAADPRTSYSTATPTRADDDVRLSVMSRAGAEKSDRIIHQIQPQPQQQPEVELEVQAETESQFGTSQIRIDGSHQTPLANSRTMSRASSPRSAPSPRSPTGSNEFRRVAAEIQAVSNSNGNGSQCNSPTGTGTSTVTVSRGISKDTPNHIAAGNTAADSTVTNIIANMKSVLAASAASTTSRGTLNSQTGTTNLQQLEAEHFQSQTQSQTQASCDDLTKFPLINSRTFLSGLSQKFSSSQQLGMPSRTLGNIMAISTGSGKSAHSANSDSSDPGTQPQASSGSLFQLLQQIFGMFLFTLSYTGLFILTLTAIFLLLGTKAVLLLVGFELGVFIGYKLYVAEMFMVGGFPDSTFILDYGVSWFWQLAMYLIAVALFQPHYRHGGFLGAHVMWAAFLWRMMVVLPVVSVFLAYDLSEVASVPEGSGSGGEGSDDSEDLFGSYWGYLTAPIWGSEPEMGVRRVAVPSSNNSAAASSDSAGAAGSKSSTTAPIPQTFDVPTPTIHLFFLSPHRQLFLLEAILALAGFCIFGLYLVYRHIPAAYDKSWLYKKSTGVTMLREAVTKLAIFGDEGLCTLILTRHPCWQPADLMMDWICMEVVPRYVERTTRMIEIESQTSRANDSRSPTWRGSPSILNLHSVESAFWGRPEGSSTNSPSPSPRKSMGKLSLNFTRRLSVDVVQHTRTAVAALVQRGMSKGNFNIRGQDDDVNNEGYDPNIDYTQGGSDSNVSLTLSDDSTDEIGIDCPNSFNPFPAGASLNFSLPGAVGSSRLPANLESSNTNITNSILAKRSKNSMKSLQFQLERTRAPEDLESEVQERIAEFGNVRLNRGMKVADDIIAGESANLTANGMQASYATLSRGFSTLETENFNFSVTTEPSRSRGLVSQKSYPLTMSPATTTSNWGSLMFW